MKTSLPKIERSRVKAEAGSIACPVPNPPALERLVHFAIDSWAEWALILSDSHRIIRIDDPPLHSRLEIDQLSKSVPEGLEPNKLHLVDLRVCLHADTENGKLDELLVYV